MHFRGPELLKKKGGTISRRNVPSCYVYAFTNKLVIRLWIGGLDLNVILMLYADLILPHGSLCIDMTSPRTYQRRCRHVVVMLYNVWLAESSRAPALWRHDHNVDDQSMAVLPIVGGDLPSLRKEICHYNTMLMRWNVCKFKDEDLKILGRYDSSWNSFPFFLQSLGALNCTFTNIKAENRHFWHDFWQ